MAKIIDTKKIKKEDFDEEYQDLVDKLGYPINSFMEQVQAALNKNINYDNLTQELVTLEFSAGDNGVPTQDLKYKSNLKNRVLGHVVINSINLTNAAVTPLNTPFITYTQNGQLVQILQVTGLTANNRYRLTVESKSV